MTKRKPEPAMDSETAAFAEAVRQSIVQVRRGAAARIYSPAEMEQIKVRRGRPVGSKQAQTKTPTTLRLNADVIERWRASGKGWQMRAAQILAQHAPA